MKWLTTLSAAVTFFSYPACLFGFNRIYAEVFAVRRDDIIGKSVFHLNYL